MSSKLLAYKSKRNLKKSGEPIAIIKKEKIGNKRIIFVIHNHYASHHHYDLRLEMSGVLKSWAVPKEPPRAKGIKRLAIQVEDHPLSYAKFQGEIKEGYGKGIVKIWDKGTYELIDKTSKKLIIKLNGKKLKGEYVLVKTKYGNKPEKSWLWFKV
ncbi:3'-phosphoesterase [Candidatus Pacearchaeota archaeon]|nr:3'-phosphoesterase [Candidatus Pacearchaeota archaeon]